MRGQSVRGNSAIWRLAVVVAVAILLGGGITYGTLRALNSAGSLPQRQVPDYHAMPQAAHHTAITVDFVSPPRRAGGSPTIAPAAPPSPFGQCASAGRGCGELIQVTDAGTAVIADLATGPYDGSAATLVGVANSSNAAVTALTITADSGVFAFAHDGICSGRFLAPARRCPFGPTGYEGPGTGFSGVSADGTTGTVTFGTPLAPGKHAYFSLAQALAPTSVAGGFPTASEQGGAPNAAERQVACSTAEPVNCATGQAWEQFRDFSIPGRGVPFDLTRTYVSGEAATDSPFGYGWTDSYAMTLTPGPGGTETVRQEDGATVTFRPDGPGRFTAPARVQATLTRGGGTFGALAALARGGTFVFARDGSLDSYAFSAAGQLIGETNTDGDTTTLQYYPNGSLARVIDPAGRALAFSYTGPYVTMVTDPMGRTQTYGYQAGNLIWAADDMGEMWRFGYVPGHLLTSVADPRGYATNIRYDRGRVALVTQPGRGSAAWSYAGDAASPGGGTTVERGPGRAVTTYDYTALRLTAVTDGTGTPLTATTGYTYGPAGLVTSVTDPELHVTRLRYDQYGNLTAVTNPLGNTTSYTYNGQFGEVTSVTLPGPGGPVSSDSYDGRGNLLSSSDGAGNVTSYSYGTTGSNYPDGTAQDPSDLVSVTGPGGQRTQLSYDGYGDVSSVAVAAAGGTDTTKYAYDLDGELACVVSPAAVAGGVNCPGPGGHQAGAQTYAYNGDGEQTSATDPNGHSTTVGYDPDGNVATITDPQHNVTNYTYSAAGEPTLETVNGAVITRTAYGPDASPLSQTTGPNDLTSYAYDALGRLRAVTDPLGETTRYDYGRDGELTAATGPQGGTARYGYNQAGELTAVTYGATSSAGYSYYADGQLSSMTDGTGVTQYSYDSDGRLAAAAHSGAAPSLYRYSYSDSTNTTVLTYPNGKQVTDTYDQTGRLQKVTDWLGDTISFGYDPGGSLIDEKLPGGVDVADAGTNNGDTLTITGGGTLATFSDSRDTNGRLSSAAATGVPGGTAPVTYGYEKAGQLGAAGQARYGYDPAGNLNLLPPGISQQFNAAGELITSGATGFRYNTAGDLLKASTPSAAPITMTYNQAGQLTAYRDGSQAASYTYDGDGLRVSKTVNGIRTDYVWDPSQAVPLLLAASGTSYVYGPGGRPVEQITGDTPTFLVADQQGNTRLLTNESGGVVGSYSYSPYGAVTGHACATAKTDPCASTAMLYDGQYTDSESGYLYLRSRYYDPATGQFLTRDQAAQSLSPYGYAGGDPVNAVDPTGLSWWNPFSWTWKTWAVIGGIVVIVGATIVTGGADLPFLGAAAGGESAAAAAGAEGGALAAAAGASAEGGLAAEVGAEGALAAETGAEAAGAAGLSSDQAAAEVLTEAAPEAGGAPEQMSAGQRFLQAFKLAYRKGRVLFKATIFGLSVFGLAKFLYKSVHAGLTCNNPNNSAMTCANASFSALSTLPSLVPKE